METEWILFSCSRFLQLIQEKFPNVTVSPGWMVSLICDTPSLGVIMSTQSGFCYCVAVTFCAHSVSGRSGVLCGSRVILWFYLVRP